MPKVHKTPDAPLNPYTKPHIASILDNAARVLPIAQHRTVRIRVPNSWWHEDYLDVRNDLMREYGGHIFQEGWVIAKRTQVLRLLREWHAKSPRRKFELSLYIELMEGETAADRSSAWLKVQMYHNGWRPPNT